MSTVEESIEPPASTTPLEAEFDLYAFLCRIATGGASQKGFVDEALSLVAARFGSPYGMLRTDADGRLEVREYKASEQAKSAWNRICHGVLLRVKHTRTASAQLYNTSSFTGPLAVLGAPIMPDGDEIIGGMAIVVPCADAQDASAQLAEFRALAALVSVAEFTRTQNKKTVASDGAARLGIAKTARYESVVQLAYALVNDLQARLAYDQVALGLVAGRSVQLTAVSGIDRIEAQNPGVQILAAVMNECLDARTIVCVQPRDADDETESDGHYLHNRWARESGGACVATAPIFEGEQISAVLAVRNPASRPIQCKQLEKVQQSVSQLAPGFALLKRADRTLARHSLDVAGRFLLGGSLVRRATFACAAGLILWLALGTTDYIVTAPCQLTPTARRVISAPFEGVVFSAFVRPGDRVDAGELIAELDTTPLAADRIRIQAELGVAEVELAAATLDRDSSTAAQAQARANAARAQLAAIDFKINHAQLRAPSAGVILTGDLLPRVGEVVPLGEPLAEFAAAGAWRIDGYVSEQDAHHLSAGQVARFAAVAKPDAPLACRVVSVGASSSIHDGRNVYTAILEIDGATPAWFRSGMEGSLHINAGRRPAWWVWLHKYLDRIRFALWSV